MALLINRNMRCIEIRSNLCGLFSKWRLIETWDVLKYPSSYFFAYHGKINRNMRCIEIPSRQVHPIPAAINRNMRCIEILWSSTEEWWRLINRNMRCIEISAFRLHQAQLWQINRNMRCIEMNWENPETSNRMINRNMRCIEILKPLLAAPLLMRLIETWDVLKST